MPEPSSVATLSLAGEAREPEAFARALGASFECDGFAIVSDHGIPPAQIARAEEAARAFFALPDAAKRAYHLLGTGGARGYTPFGTEAAKGAREADLKEFWHVGRELRAGHPLGVTMAPNIWPVEIAGFREAMLDLFAAFDVVGARLLAAIARYLGLAADWFVEPVRDGNSVLRLLRYPPLPSDAKGLRAAPHEDINAITLLLGAEEAGLELLDRQGRWRPVAPAPGELVVNVGDMLQRLTNNCLRSTTHRVRNPAPERRAHARLSMPFFLHFRPDFRIETLPGCIGPERPNAYPEPITADAYLQERLREIRLL